MRGCCAARATRSRQRGFDPLEALVELAHLLRGRGVGVPALLLES